MCQDLETRTSMNSQPNEMDIWVRLGEGGTALPSGMDEKLIAAKS